MLCSNGCGQRAAIIQQLLTGDKTVSELFQELKDTELFKNLKSVQVSQYAQIYKYLHRLEEANLIIKKGKKWSVPGEKKSALRELLDPPLLEVYFAGAWQAIDALRSLDSPVPFLLSAGLCWISRSCVFKLRHELDFASTVFVDSGAQQFYSRFKKFSYPYSIKDYVDFSNDIAHADLIATMDLPLDIVTPRGLSVAKGLRKTVEYAVDIIEYAQNKNIRKKIVPVIQGFNDPDQWLESIDLYKSHGIDGKTWGIGSLCLVRSSTFAAQVVNVIHHRLRGRKLHVFGLGLDIFRHVFESITSCDTSAWVYWAKMDGAVFAWDHYRSAFMQLQARDGKRYDSVALMRMNAYAIQQMVHDYNLKKSIHITTGGPVSKEVSPVTLVKK